MVKSLGKDNAYAVVVRCPACVNGRVNGPAIFRLCNRAVRVNAVHITSLVTAACNGRV